MPALALATLEIVRSADSEKRAEGTETIQVQFNPNNLQITFAPANSPPPEEGRQQVQSTGTGSATVTMELHFDTADEMGDGGKARSVLQKTRPIEALTLPRSVKEKQGPPLVRFHWGEVIITGYVATLSTTLDFFSEGGVPLRAKVNLTIKEQNAKLAYAKAGTGADGANATKPGAAGLGAAGGIGLGLSASLGAGVGSGLSAGLGLGASLAAGVSVNAQTALAIGGESAAEFAARVGVDPKAWRAIATGQVDGTLSLRAGAEIDFRTDLSVAAGIGVSTGVEANVHGSIESAFGLSAPAVRDTSAAQTAPGFALSAAGGVSAALATVDVVRTESAATQTRAAFDAPPRPALPSPASGAPAVAIADLSRGLASVPRATAAAAARAPSGPTSPPRPDKPEQPHPPLGITGLPSPAQQLEMPAAPPPPMPDPRATSYGFGVPLRPRVGGAAQLRAGSLGGFIPLRPRQRTPRPGLGQGGVLPMSNDPSAPPWVALSNLGAQAIAMSSGPSHNCGCGCCAACRGKGTH